MGANVGEGVVCAQLPPSPFSLAGGLSFLSAFGDEFVSFLLKFVNWKN
jgi:hypothetical protein